MRTPMNTCYLKLSWALNAMYAMNLREEVTRFE
ncbi:unnamed protein product, partial [Rotaria sp. Silwood1]